VFVGAGWVEGEGVSIVGKVRGVFNFYPATAVNEYEVERLVVVVFAGLTA
jgi:hypothetical protein